MLLACLFLKLSGFKCRLCVKQHTKQKRFCESEQYFVSSLDAPTDFWGFGFSWLVDFCFP